MNILLLHSCWLVRCTDMYVLTYLYVDEDDVFCSFYCDFKQALLASLQTTVFRLCVASACYAYSFTLLHFLLQCTYICTYTYICIYISAYWLTLLVCVRYLSYINDEVCMYCNVHNSHRYLYVLYIYGTFTCSKFIFRWHEFVVNLLASQDR